MYMNREEFAMSGTDTTPKSGTDTTPLVGTDTPPGVDIVKIHVIDDGPNALIPPWAAKVLADIENESPKDMATGVIDSTNAGTPANGVLGGTENKDSASSKKMKRIQVTLGVATGILVLALIAKIASDRPGSVGSTTSNPIPAGVALQQLDKQLNTTAKILNNFGYNPALIARQKTIATLASGTQIMELAIPNPGTNAYLDGELVAVGPSSPDRYASIQSVDTNAYLMSLSQHPTVRDITRNSAAVHGLGTEIEK
jgi:hypothetical protein